MKELFTYIQENQPDVKLSFGIKLTFGMDIKDEDLIIDKFYTTYLHNARNLYYLPDNLHVNMSLSVRHSSIEKIPNNLYIGKNFHIDKIYKFPENMYVGKYIICRDVKQENELELLNPKYADQIVTATDLFNFQRQQRTILRRNQ